MVTRIHNPEYNLTDFHFRGFFFYQLNHTKAQIAKNGGVINHQHREIFITDTFIECLGKKKVADMGFSIVSIKHF